MYWYKNPLVQKYPTRIRWVALGVMSSFILMAYIFPRTIDYNNESQSSGPKKIDDFEAPPITQQVELIKPPPRPSVPIASEDDEFDIDISIEDTDLDNFEDYQPPSFDDDEVFETYQVEKLPIERKGYEVRKFVKYPDLAREAGIEGRVIVRALIGKKGRVEQVELIQGVFPSLDEEALKAVKKSVWTPAMQGSKRVKVWMIVPVLFQLQ